MEHKANFDEDLTAKRLRFSFVNVALILVDNEVPECWKVWMVGYPSEGLAAVSLYSQSSYSILAENVYQDHFWPAGSEIPPPGAFPCRETEVEMFEEDESTAVDESTVVESSEDEESSDDEPVRPHVSFHL